VVSRSYDWRALAQDLYRIHCAALERARQRRAL